MLVTSVYPFFMRQIEEIIHVLMRSKLGEDHPNICLVRWSDDRSRIEVIDIQETISSIEVANIGVKLIQPFVGKDHS